MSKNLLDQITPWTNVYPSPGVSDADLIEWCTLKGMPQSKATTLTRNQLNKCYAIKNYFDTVAGNRPRNLKQIRQANQAFRNSLTNIDLGSEELLPNSNDTACPYAPVHRPGLDPGAPPNTTNVQLLDELVRGDPIKTLLSTVEQTIDQRLQSYKGSIIRDAVANINGTLVNIQENTFKNLKTALESGTIEANLSQSTVQRIIDLATKTTNEIIFHALKQQHEKPGNIDNTDSEPTPAVPPDPSFLPSIDPDFYFDPWVSRVLISSITNGINTYISGDAGCGKTTTVEQVCVLMNRGVFRINPHDGLTRSFFLGEMKLETDEQGNSITRFQYGALPKAMMEGLVLLIDEFSFLTSNLSAVLHPPMEPGRTLYIPETGEHIKAAPGFCVIATDNTGGKGDSSGQFVGTEVQNTATLDRFGRKLIMDYMPDTEEHKLIVKKFPNQDEDEIEELIKLAAEIRKAFSQSELAITLSTRGLIDYFIAREHGFSQEEALNLRLLSWLDDDDRTLVENIIDRLGIKLTNTNNQTQSRVPEGFKAW